MKNQPTKVLFGLALGLLMVGAGCSSTTTVKTEVTPSPAPAPAEQPSAAAGTQLEGSEPVNDTPDAAINVEADAKVDAALGALKEVKLTAKQFSFSPAEIRVKQGERVRLVVTSEDVSHGVSIPAFNVNLTLEPSKTGTAEFVADKKGSFPFFCNVFCGSGHGGMKGTLIVE